MQSTKPALLLFSLIVLAGCNQRDIAGSTTPSATAAAPEAPTAGASLPAALPEGFSLGFPHHYVGQETARVGKAQRQRITVEYLDGDANSAVGSLAQSALAAGFEKGLWGAQKDGSIHFVADKAGYGQLRAQIRPVAGETLQNPSAKGTVTMGWPADVPQTGTEEGVARK